MRRTPACPTPRRGSRFCRARCSPRPTTCAATRIRRPTATGATPTRPGRALERAIGELDGGRTVVFSSGMAAVTAVVLPRLRPGDVLVACGDGYPGIRQISEADLRPKGIEVRMVRTDTEEIVAAADGATLVWVETPSNPRLDVCDLDAVRAATTGAAGGRQHGRDAARLPAARPRRRLRRDLGDQGPDRTLRRAARRRQRARPGPRAGARRLAHPHRQHPRPVRGLARPPLAGHPRAAARAPAGQRPGPGGGARGPRDGSALAGHRTGDLARAADRRGSPGFPRRL